MATLYTTLSHAKAAGRLTPPVMMSIPSQYRDLIDPELVLGLGGLIEDDERGLKCPVRGCDEWRHSLGRHLTAAHNVDVATIRKALSLPKSVGLVSARTHDRMVARLSGTIRLPSPAFIAARGTGGHQNRRRRLAIGIRNARTTCHAQLLKKLEALYADTGHVPTQREGIMALGAGPFKAIVRTFGTWNQALISIGISPRIRLAWRVTPELVLSSWRAFFEQHGRWPSQGESHHGTQAPMIPSPNAVRRALGVQRWSDAVAAVEAMPTLTSAERSA